MGKATLQQWLLGNSGFVAQYRKLLIDSVAAQFPNLVRTNNNEEHDWKYLLMCASLLAQSDNERCQDVALRISQYCLESGDATQIDKDAAAVVLDSLANRPAIHLAESRQLLQENYEDRLPFPLFLDWTRRSIEHTVSLSNGQSLNVNRFQKLFWNRASRYDWVSISAPTSAGKSYIIGRWLGEYLRANPRATVVYIVPTRALIQQVEKDIMDVLAEENLSDVSVVTLPLRSSITREHANVLVFTQERFHILLAERDCDISVDLLVIDEAQKIGDKYRGVLLQQAIEIATWRHPECKVFFASPMTDNPEILLQDAPISVSTTDVLCEDITVNQNLLWATEARGQSTVWNVEIVLQDGPVQIGSISLPSRPTPESKRLPFVAYSLGNIGGGNVIYVNGAADAEKTAKQLYDLVGVELDCSGDEEIHNIVELIKKTVHHEYSLCRVLQRGIAFHYGNMPLLIRTEIERLFKTNKIKFLVCTSTLIEGINMPCQSMFVRGPTKGRGEPMSQSDFWNLAGRAGRWGKEFQGNVVCVDARQAGVWKLGAPQKRERFRISRTSDQVMDRSDELLQFIHNRTPRDLASNKPNLEYMFSYLVSSFIRNGSVESAAWSRRYPTELIGALQTVIADIVDCLSTPHEIILRNPGISPIAMDALLNYFNNRTVERQEDVEGLIPVQAESEDAFEAYTKILHRINRYLGKDVFGRGNRVKQLALLIVDWMRGYPLARMISSREQHYGSDKLASLIRGTMKDVEEYARFQAPKYLTCYVDLLRVYLERIERYDLLGRLIELNVLLEFGVSQKTQLSLMGLGLSRTSTVAISEYISSDSLGESQCLAWLHENDWMTHDLPELVKREIRQIMTMHAARAPQG